MPQRDESVVLEDVNLIFRNFAGREGMYNREGDRNFAVELPADVAKEMAANGWNVKLRKRRDDEEEEDPQPYISVAVNFKGRFPPTIKMIGSKSGRSTQLDEETVEILDYVDILQTDLIISPYDWAVSGNTGRKAYLRSLYVTIIEDPLQLKYGDLTIATVDGPMMEHTEPLVVESERADGRRAIESGRRK
jgi:hypothetical protein